MKLRIYMPVLFDKGSAFSVPGYRLVKTWDKLEEWWLFPFNYPVQFWYWVKSKT